MVIFLTKECKPGCILQTRVYGFDGFQTWVPGYPGLEVGYPVGSQ